MPMGGFQERYTQKRLGDGVEDPQAAFVSLTTGRRLIRALLLACACGIHTFALTIVRDSDVAA
jgi:hypothetical protein